MARKYDVKLILKDGSEYAGYRFGAPEERIFEVVFNTSMVGYQEIVSDPSYTDQAVVMTYPLIGNYGVNGEDAETRRPSIGGLVVGEYNPDPSNFRSRENLSEYLIRFGIPGLAGVDTRKLARSIRDHGSQPGILTDIGTDSVQAMEKLSAYAAPHDAVSRVSTDKIRFLPAQKTLCRVAVIDCGIKENIIRSLNRRGCDVTVFPYDTPVHEITRMNPDGLFLSNGPGDPEDVTPVIELVRQMRGKLPIFGICLGHQMIALAYGAKTYKLKFGHRGGNHPVRNLITGKVEVTSQNHSYAVVPESLPGTGLETTHINLLDGTVEGLRCSADHVFSVQYHPESAPGPEDSGYLFDLFIKEMREWGGEQNA